MSRRSITRLGSGFSKPQPLLRWNVLSGFVCRRRSPSHSRLFCPLSASGPLGRGAKQSQILRRNIMSQNQYQMESPQAKDSISPQEPTSKDPPQLSQEEMKCRYLEQQRRLACPGCAEEPFLG